MLVFFVAAVSLSFRDVKVRAIIKFRQVEDGTVFYADLLDGMDFSKTPAPFTDRKGGTIKVGIFAMKETDGTTKTLRYETRVLSPEELKMSDGKIVRCDNPEIRFIKKSVQLSRRGIWHDDLQRMYKGKLKLCKSERDNTLKRRKYSRLYNWCNANFLFKNAEKIGKELDKLEALQRKSDREKEKAKEKEQQEEESGFDAEARDGELADALKGITGSPDVLVRSSTHAVIATNHIPEKTVNELLKLGELVFEDFADFMYDVTLEKTKPLPDEEIFRFFYFHKLDDLDAALQSARKLSFGGNYSIAKDRLRFLKSGSVGSSVLKGRNAHRTFFASMEAGDPADPSSVKKRNRDLRDVYVHQLSHALIENRMRPDFVNMMGGRQMVMPWLEEGMAIYLTIKHLGTKNSACVDFTKKKSKYASQGKKKEKDFHMWEGDVEAMVNRIALDDSADPFDVMIRIPTYRGLKPETVAKAFSLIDFLIQTDRVGFLDFLERIQKLYKVLYKGKDQAAFIRGLDDLVHDCFPDAAVKKGRRVVRMETVKDLEEAWKDWAGTYVKKGTHKK